MTTMDILAVISLSCWFIFYVIVGDQRPTYAQKILREIIAMSAFFSTLAMLIITVEKI